MRLQKFMANNGVASRRKSEELILEGLVTVNGKVVKELGTKVEDGDTVKVNGVRVKKLKEFTYILLNKPMGVVTTVSDEKNRKTVVDCIEINSRRIYPVGRLDIDSTGLVFLTDDGEVAQKLMHPSREVVKTYIVTLEGTPNAKSLKRLREGVMLEGKRTAPAKVKVLKSYDMDSIVSISIHEGRNHQIKNMCAAVEYPVKKLKRIKIGELELGGLESGQWRYATNDEIQYLKDL